MNPEYAPELIPPAPEERTPEAFYRMYGDRIGLTWEQFSVMRREGLSLIGYEYEYHNGNHPDEMLWTSMQIADRIEREQGITVNRKIVIAIDTHHDSGHH